MTASLPTIEPASPKSGVVLDPVCESPTAILDRARKELAEKTDSVLDPAEFPPFSPGVPSADLEEEVSVATSVIVDLAISDPTTAPSSPEPLQAPRANTYDTFHPFRHRASARHRHLELAERAYIAASKSPSTPIASRLEAAHRASACHKNRTGLGLCINPAAVLSEGAYAEDFETACLENPERRTLKWANPSVAEFKPAAESIGINPVTPRSPSPIRKTVYVPHEFSWCLERQSQEMEGVCRGIVKRREWGWYEWEKDPGDLLVPAVVERYWRPCRAGTRPSRLFDQGRRIGNLVASAGGCGVEAGGLGLGACEVGCVWC